MKIDLDLDIGTTVAIATFICGVAAFFLRRTSKYYAAQRSEAIRLNQQENSIKDLRVSLGRAKEDINVMSQQVELIRQQVQDQALTNASTKTELANLQRISLRTEASIQELSTLIIRTLATNEKQK